MVSHTDVSSIRSGCPSQSAIWVFDCDMADSHVSSRKAAARAHKINRPRRLWQVSFSAKLKPTITIIRIITNSIKRYMLSFIYSSFLLRLRRIRNTSPITATRTAMPTRTPLMRLTVVSVTCSSSCFITIPSLSALMFSALTCATD